MGTSGEHTLRRDGSRRQGIIVRLTAVVVEDLLVGEHVGDLGRGVGDLHDLRRGVDDLRDLGGGVGDLLVLGHGVGDFLKLVATEHIRLATRFPGAGCGGEVLRTKT